MAITPIARRIAVGKAIGLGFGLAAFVLVPVWVPDADPLLLWGVLFWYMTVGAVIGMAGVLDRHPALDLPLGWYLRAPIIGAWMNLNLVLIAHEPLIELTAAFVPGATVATVFTVALVEGAAIGWLIGAVASMVGGEGRRHAVRG